MLVPNNCLSGVRLVLEEFSPEPALPENQLINVHKRKQLLKLITCENMWNSIIGQGPSFKGIKLVMDCPPFLDVLAFKMEMA
jgi:hypothetical protein